MFLPHYKNKINYPLSIRIYYCCYYFSMYCDILKYISIVYIKVYIFFFFEIYILKCNF